MMTPRQFAGGVGGGMAAHAPGGLADVLGGTWGPLGLLDAPGRAVRGGLMSLLGQAPEPPFRQATARDVATTLGGAMAGAMPQVGGVPGASSLAQGLTGAMGGLGPQRLPYTAPADDIDVPFPDAPAQATPKSGTLMPALAGLAAGGLAAFTPLAAFAPMIGAGTAGLAQTLGETFAPDDFGSFSSGELNDRLGQTDLGRKLGVSDNLGANLLTGLLTDPLSVAGFAGGAKAATGAASAAEGRLGRLAADEARLVAKPGAAALAPPQLSLGSPSAGVAPGLRTASLMEPAAAASAAKAPAGALAAAEAAPGQLSGYTPEMLAKMFGGAADDFAHGGAAAAGNAYKRVNPDVQGLLQYLGKLGPGNERLAQLPGGWAHQSGGRVLGVPGSQGTISHLQDLAGMGGGGHGALTRMRERLALLDSAVPMGWSPSGL